MGLKLTLFSEITRQIQGASDVSHILSEDMLDFD